MAEGRASADRRPRLAFVCSGQGPQWWAMGRQLLREEPAFRAAIERCDAIVRRLGDWSLLDELTADEAALAHGRHRDLAALHLRASGGAGRAVGLLGRAAGGRGGAQRRRGGGRLPGRSVRPGRRGPHHLPPRAVHGAGTRARPDARRRRIARRGPATASPAMATASPSPR